MPHGHPYHSQGSTTTEGARRSSYSYTSAYDHRKHIEQLSPREFIARLASHIPDHNERLVRYSEHYSNRSRGARRARTPPIENGAVEEKPLPTRWRSQWQQLLSRVFDVSLTCHICKTEMKVIALQFILLVNILSPGKKGIAIASTIPGEQREEGQDAGKEVPGMSFLF